MFQKCISILFVCFTIFSLDAAIREIKPPSASFDVPKIRVRIGKSLKKVLVSGTDIKRYMYADSTMRTYSGRKGVEFNCQTLLFPNKENARPVLIASLNSPTGIISFEQEKYQGKIVIQTSPLKNGCDVVNEISLEEYIGPLLSKEMNASWPLEALKAQAVAARTYAINKMQSQLVSRNLGHEAFYDLESSEKHQVGGNFFDATEATFRAAKETKGKILTLNGSEKITPIFFHAKCGGRTLLPNQVWDNNVDGYHSVYCPYCKDHGKKNWQLPVSREDLKKFLGWMIRQRLLDEGLEKSVSAVGEVMLAPDRINNSRLRIYLGDHVIVFKKTLLRRYFGRVKFPSNRFSVEMNKGELVVNGAGLGHGVGMCQLGALDLAKMGWNYTQILAHYFPEHKLTTIY